MDDGLDDARLVQLHRFLKGVVDATAFNGAIAVSLVPVRE